MTPNCIIRKNADARTTNAKIQRRRVLTPPVDARSGGDAGAAGIPGAGPFCSSESWILSGMIFSPLLRPDS
jgi:hypothetical protein